MAIRKSNGIHKVKGTHKVRYLVLPELVGSLENSDFKLLETGEWMTGKPLGWESWSAYSVGQG